MPTTRKSLSVFLSLLLFSLSMESSPLSKDKRPLLPQRQLKNQLDNQEGEGGYAPSFSIRPEDQNEIAEPAAEPLGASADNVRRELEAVLNAGSSNGQRSTALPKTLRSYPSAQPQHMPINKRHGGLLVSLAEELGSTTAAALINAFTSIKNKQLPLSHIQAQMGPPDSLYYLMVLDEQLLRAVSQLESGECGILQFLDDHILGIFFGSDKKNVVRHILEMIRYMSLKEFASAADYPQQLHVYWILDIILMYSWLFEELEGAPRHHSVFIKNMQLLIKDLPEKDKLCLSELFKVVFPPEYVLSTDNVSIELRNYRVNVRNALFARSLISEGWLAHAQRKKELFIHLHPMNIDLLNESICYRLTQRNSCVEVWQPALQPPNGTTPSEAPTLPMAVYLCCARKEDGIKMLSSSEIFHRFFSILKRYRPGILDREAHTFTVEYTEESFSLPRETSSPEERSSKREVVLGAVGAMGVFIMEGIYYCLHYCVPTDIYILIGLLAFICLFILLICLLSCIKQLKIKHRNFLCSGIALLGMAAFLMSFFFLFFSGAREIPRTEAAFYCLTGAAAALLCFKMLLMVLAVIEKHNISPRKFYRTKSILTAALFLMTMGSLLFLLCTQIPAYSKSIHREDWIMLFCLDSALFCGALLLLFLKPSGMEADPNAHSKVMKNMLVTLLIALSFLGACGVMAYSGATYITY